MALLGSFIGPHVIEKDFKKISNNTYYPIPDQYSLTHYKSYLRKYPDVDRPDIFGLDENATIIKSQTEAKTLLEKVYELEFASKNLIKDNKEEENDDIIVSKYTAIKDKMHKIITELPELLDEEQCRKKFPISYQECLNTLLLKEAQRYNLLLQVIYVSLKNTLKALEGIAHINDILDSIYSDITYGKVPSSWLKYCYPTFDSLSTFLSNLQDRISFYKGWIDWGHPQNFWLPGLFDQKSFITTLLQQKARKDNIYFSTLALEFTPLELNANIPDPPKPKINNEKEKEIAKPMRQMDEEDSASDLSSSSILSKNQSSKLSKIEEERDDSDEDGEGNDKQKELYIHGLYIECAQWDYDDECIIEAKSRILNYIMPAFSIKVITKDEYAKKYKNDKYFETPLFKISLREAINLDGECFVMYVPLKISEGTDPSFWLKRSTALFCQMNM